MMEPTVFIIDDDPSARRGLTRLLRAADIHAEAFASAADFLGSGRSESPGCMVLDVRMPEMSGPQLLDALSKASYRMPIVFLSAHGDVPTTARAMRKGAVDFLTKPVDREDLLRAVREGLAKDAELRAAAEETKRLQQRVACLTEREHQVMTYVITGMLNKQIASEMRITEDTVKVHRGRVMRKLGIDSVAELVRLCEKAEVSPATPGEP